MAKRAWMPATDTELYQKILVIFSVVQLVMGLALYILSEIPTPILCGLLVVGIVTAVLAHRFWHSSSVRIVCRILLYLLTIGTVPLIAVYVYKVILQMQSLFVSAIPAASVTIVSLIMINTVWLFLFPAMALAALHGQRIDVNFLRVFAVLETALSAFLYFFPLPLEHLNPSIDNLYFRIFCMACVAATMVASFLIPPPLNLKRSKANKKEKALPEQSE